MGEAPTWRSLGDSNPVFAVRGRSRTRLMFCHGRPVKKHFFPNFSPVAPLIRPPNRPLWAAGQKWLALIFLKSCDCFHAGLLRAFSKPRTSPIRLSQAPVFRILPLVLAASQ